MAEVATLDCPCCGDDACEGDAEGLFYEGQALICGCKGYVVVDDTDVDLPAAYADVDEDGCLCASATERRRDR